MVRSLRDIIRRLFARPFTSQRDIEFLGYEAYCARPAARSAVSRRPGTPRRPPRIWKKAA